MRRILILCSLAVVLFAGTSVASAQTTTTAPATYAKALEARLAKEWKDPTLAKEIVAGLGADTLASFEAKVPQAQVATSPFLAYRPKPIPAKKVDSLIVYSFGNRVDAAGVTTAGPTNEELAKAVQAFVKRHPMPVYAQHEVAQFLHLPEVHSIDETVGPDGKVVYLSTAGVAAAAYNDAAVRGKDLGTVGVVCFADHAGRCLLTTQKVFGVKGVGIPKGITLPSTYDPQSGQSWTRDRKTYLQTDLLGRLATV